MKKRLCNSCKFGTVLTGIGVGCGYMLLTGHSRGCEVENCEKYMKGKRIPLPTSEKEILKLQSKMQELVLKTGNSRQGSNLEGQ